MRDLILLFLFRQFTPLITCAYGVHYGWGNDDGQRLKTCRLLVESKADITARQRCFSPLISSPLSPCFTDSFYVSQLRNCAHICHQQKQFHRRCIPPQHRCAGMTRPPPRPAAPLQARPAHFKYTFSSCHRCCRLSLQTLASCESLNNSSSPHCPLPLFYRALFARPRRCEMQLRVNSAAIAPELQRTIRSE